MIFLSQLIGVRIFDNKQEEIGRVNDLLVEAKNVGYPRVKAVVFKRGKDKAVIPFSCVENMSRAEVTLSKSNCWKVRTSFSPEEIFLFRHVVDQQIFDVKGIRVVRVNDIQLSKIESNYCLIGIDISNKALYRRLGVGDLPFFRSSEPKFIDWHNINFVKGNVGGLKLKTPYQKLEKLHPADIANLIENLTLQESTKLVQAFDEEMAAEVLGEVDPEYKDTLLERIHPKNLADILEEMPTDEAADVIQDLSEHKRIQVFRRLGLRKAKVLHKLTAYEEDRAGGLMTSEFMTVSEDFTVTEAVEEIRKKSDEHQSIYHVFVLDKDKSLIGIVSMRTLLLSGSKKKMKDIMSKVVRTVRLRTRAEEVARIMTKYNLLSLAVIDKENRLRGIITVDDIMRLLVPDA